MNLFDDLDLFDEDEEKKDAENIRTVSVFKTMTTSRKMKILSEESLAP